MSTEQERAAFRAGFLAVWNRPHDENPAHWSFDGPAAVDKEPEAWAAWAETAPPAGAQGETPKRCEGDQHIADGIGGCQCGNLYSRNLAPEGSAQQAEEIARLRTEVEYQMKEARRMRVGWDCSHDAVKAERAQRISAERVKLDAESQAQALQAHLSEAQQRIETLTRLAREVLVWLPDDLASSELYAAVDNLAAVVPPAPPEDQP